MALRKVKITLTKKVVGSYEARSYPHDDYDNDGFIELYKVPVHEIIVAGTDNKGKPQTFIHKAPRFMPYWNNPKSPDPDYKTKGWINSGLSAARTIVVRRYKPDYELHNRYSPFFGAIVLKDAFYIHPGPADEKEVGFGSAGCVEIIGNYDIFKLQIASLSGSASAVADAAIEQLVRAGKLTVVIEATATPDIKKLYSRKVARKVLFPTP